MELNTHDWLPLSFHGGQPFIRCKWAKVTEIDNSSLDSILVHRVQRIQELHLINRGSGIDSTRT